MNLGVDTRFGSIHRRLVWFALFECCFVCTALAPTVLWMLVEMYEVRQPGISHALLFEPLCVYAHQALCCEAWSLCGICGISATF